MPIPITTTRLRNRCPRASGSVLAVATETVGCPDATLGLPVAAAANSDKPVSGGDSDIISALVIA